ncbi:MAG: adenylate/guanylate cyclase domain-containing protein, partial [Thermodesulfobacteriota bacterium]
ALGESKRTIRIHNTSGIAGHTFTTEEAVVIDDVSVDKRFNPEVDRITGFVTRNILCTPIKTFTGETIGVAQMLNKVDGNFTEKDVKILESMTRQASVPLLSSQTIERMQASRAKELEFLDVVVDITSEIDLAKVLNKIMSEVTRMLNAERSTLFINDEKTNELWSEVGEGVGRASLRFPNHVGIAGTVFTTGETVNIPYAYSDMRFNPAFDSETGFFTRSILCTPVVNKTGKTIGVTQVLNKKGSVFSDEDSSRLKAFTAQVSIALENAKLFDNVQSMKNYNESMLESMSNGVITLDENARIITCNAAGQNIMGTKPEDIIDKEASDFFAGKNDWVIEKLGRLSETGSSNYFADVELEGASATLNVNLTLTPLMSGDNIRLGSMILIEDISSEKRMKSTMSRYMDPGLADQLLNDSSENILGGNSVEATVLFTDIRGFTPLTEELGAQGTVSLLNEYFTLMVECIQEEGGMLDKFIGDAIMAAFGIPVKRTDDEDRAIRCAVKMMAELRAWNEKRVGKGMKEINIGVGLNTDTVVSGNIGSPKRMDYTIIGDGVNLAARLESACKQYGANILVSENTYKRLKGTYKIRHIDDVIVKGKTEPAAVYEVLDFHTKKSFPSLMEVMGHFEEGRDKYSAGTFDAAAKSFKRALKLNPGDKISKLYIERCKLLKEDPPKGDWNGVWIMTSK